MEDKKVQFVTVIALIYDDEKRILFQQRYEPDIPEAHEKWEFPGGVVEFGEQPEDALRRECREEIGCDVEVERLLPHIQTNFWRKEAGELIQAFVFCYVCRIANGVPRSSNEEVGEVRWFSKEETEEVEALPGIQEFVNLA